VESVCEQLQLQLVYLLCGKLLQTFGGLALMPLVLSFLAGAGVQ
jgi:hypothetical protein